MASNRVSRSIPLRPHCRVPRALPVRQTITIDVTPEEHFTLVRALEAEAVRAARTSEQAGYADYLMQRVAALREAAR